MFRALPYIKPHPVPGSLLPSNGKVVRSKILPCLNRIKQHRNRYKNLVCVCTREYIWCVCVCVRVSECLAKDFDQIMRRKENVKWDSGD